MVSKRKSLAISRQRKKELDNNQSETLPEPSPTFSRSKSESRPLEFPPSPTSMEPPSESDDDFPTSLAVLTRAMRSSKRKSEIPGPKPKAKAAKLSSQEAPLKGGEKTMPRVATDDSKGKEAHKNNKHEHRNTWAKDEMSGAHGGAEAGLMEGSSPKSEYGPEDDFGMSDDPSIASDGTDSGLEGQNFNIESSLQDRWLFPEILREYKPRVP
ncbi:hypothetical protein C8J57DRAFT_1238832 [Mycena rebaudengoi]|nr:hypothetical protein C8J57DRAFT_1238832 [Mycena rebaudengoi]